MFTEQLAGDGIITPVASLVLSNASCCAFVSTVAEADLVPGNLKWGCLGSNDSVN
jgi:hypothetical protein